MADAGIALGVLVVGHSRPGEVHDVGADDRGLQQARTGVGCEDKCIRCIDMVYTRERDI